MKVFQWIDNKIDQLSGKLIVIMVFAMLILSFTTIVLRWFGIGFIWIGILNQHIVFISIFLGGAIATGRGVHIGIDIINKYLENKKNQTLLSIVNIITSIACILTIVWLTYASIEFVKSEAQYGNEVFWGIHSKYLTSIIPIGLSLIGYRFFYKVLANINQLKK